MLKEDEEKVVEDIKAGMNVTELCLKYGMNRTYPYKIAEKYGLKLSAKKNRKTVNAVPITKLHATIGEKLCWERHFRLKKDLKIAASEIGMTTTKLNMIEKGTLDVTLMELMKLSDYYGVSVWAMIKSASESQFEERTVFNI